MAHGDHGTRHYNGNRPHHRSSLFPSLPFVFPPSRAHPLSLFSIPRSLGAKRTKAVRPSIRTYIGLPRRVHGRMLSYFFAAGSLHPSLFPSRPTDRSGVHTSHSLLQWELAGSRDNVGVHDGTSYPPIPRKSVGGILRFLSPRELARSASP